MSNPTVVIYRLGSLGDTIAALPCFHKIAEAFPDFRKVVLTNIPVASNAPPLEVILGGSGLIDGAIAYPLGVRSTRELLALRRQLRALGAKTLVYLAASRGLASSYRDWFYFRSCGFTRIVGVPLTPDLLQNRIDPGTGEEEPESARLARTMALLGPVDLQSADAWNLRLTEAEKAVGRETIAPLGDRPYMAINMGGKVVEKDWGLERWRGLMRALSVSHGDLGLLIVGAAEDSARAVDLARDWLGPFVDACGRLSPRESAAAMTRARVFIGHDSGPLHLAAASGVRCVGIFGHYNKPRKWHPCFGKHTIIHRTEGIDRITVDEVAHASRAILS